MSDSTAENAASETTEAPARGSGRWPDETVDAICALIVISAVTLGVLWYVVNG